MSDPNEPTGPEGSADRPAPTPPSSEPPPPPSSDLPPPPPPGDTYGGAADGGADSGGGYGAPPPASPYGQPAAGGQEAPYSPTEAFGYGWRKFSASPGTLLIPMLVAWVGIVVTAILVELLIVQTMLGTHDCTKTVNGISFSGQCSPNFFVQLLGAGLAIGIVTVVSQILIAGLYKGAANIADGKAFSLGTMLDGWDKAQVVIAAILIAVATAIGTILCYIPGLVVGFLTIFTILFVVDKQLTAVDAIKASFELVTKNFGHTLVFWILAAIALFVGALLCGLGLLVAAPVVLIGLAYTYRRLQGEPVAP